MKESKQEFSIPDGEISRSKLMMMIKKMNDMRIRARTEIMKLNSKIQTNNNHYEELMKLKMTMMEKEKVIADTKGIIIVIIILSLLLSLFLSL